MATINFSNIIYRAKNFSKSKTNQNASGTGLTKPEALVAATNNATNQINNAGWSSGASEEGNGTIGRWKGNATVTDRNNINYILMDDTWWCGLKYSGNQYGKLYQTHLKFTIPSGVAADNIKSATLKITTTSNSNISICVCGPSGNTTIADNVYYDYNADALYYGDTSYNTNNKTTINLDIKKQFKKCINNNQGVLVVTPYLTSSQTYNTDYINGLDFTLTYELDTTPCQPPTSIQDNGTNFIVPNGAIKLKWSGAQTGTNNAIAGYRIYWGTRNTFEPGDGVVGYYDFTGTNTSCSFSSATNGNMPSVRGTTYYFKICTKGSIKVDNKWYSDISTVNCSIVFNNLPNSPSINDISSGTSIKSKPSRIKSEGTTSVEFNVTPGNTNNTGQTGSVYYSLPGESEKHPFNGTINLTRPSTGDTISVYFFTYDGYEYSSNSSCSVPINTKPTVTINEGNDGINYNLNGYDFTFGAFQSSWVTITGYQGATFKNKHWEIWINDSIDQANAPTVGNKNLIDICNINFGNSFGLKYVVEDDIGEIGTSELWYPKDINNNRINFPNAPTYSFSDGVNNSNFGTNLEIDFNSTNISSSKLTLYLNYKSQIDNSWNDNNKIEIGKLNNTFGTVNCSNLIRGMQYNFKIKFLLSNTKFTDIEYNLTMRRAPDITPTNGTTLTITPFIPSTATFSFECNGITNLDQLKNKNIKFKFSTNELAPSSISYSISSSNIIRAELNYNIASSNWQTFISNQNQLNKIYNGKIQVSVEDLCNDTFTNEFDIHYDFSNSLNASNNLSGSLQIKCDNNNYISLSDNNYPLFENQILRINLSNLKSYCSETVHFVLYDHADGNRNYNITTTIQLNHSNGDTTRPIYTSGTNDYIEFTIPEILNENSEQNITYFTLDVINEASQIDKKKFINIYSSEVEQVKLCRCNTNAINFTITKIEKNDNLFKFYYTVTDFGGTGENPRVDDYKWMGVQFYYSNDGINYNNYFTLTQITNNPIEILNNTNFGEKVYFKAEIKVINDFEPVNSMTPAGIDYHIRSYENSEEFIFYNSIPNLAYGKNFFLINTTNVSNLNDDYILVVRPIDYTVEVNNNNTETHTRNKIYFGATGEESYMEITQNGLVIDGGTWNI